MNVSRRLQAVQAPIIPVVGDLIRRTPGTISLGQGVVYYGPPPEALEAARRFPEDLSDHKYKAVEGIPPLLEALAGKLKAENGVANRTNVLQCSCTILYSTVLSGFRLRYATVSTDGKEQQTCQWGCRASRWAPSPEVYDLIRHIISASRFVKSRVERRRRRPGVLFRSPGPTSREPRRLRAACGAS